MPKSPKPKKPPEPKKPPKLNRDVARQRLLLWGGVNLRLLAEQYGITVFKPGGGFNKGWVGLTLERYLELPPNSVRTGDFMDEGGPWELKTVPLRMLVKIWQFAQPVQLLT